MSWNFRVYKEIDPATEEIHYSIVEAFSLADDPSMERYSEAVEPVVDLIGMSEPDADTLEGLAWVLEKMTEALNHPVIVWDDEESVWTNEKYA